MPNPPDSGERPLRAAVVGTHWGRVHVAALRAAGVDVVALVARNRIETQSAAAELGIGHATNGLADLAVLGLDLVTLATPVETHHRLISELSRRLPQVPILCEKPAVGLSPRQPLPADRRAPVWVNYAFAFLDVAARAGAAVEQIGQVTRAEVVSAHDLPGVPADDAAMFVDLVPHPWSWLVTVLGPVTIDHADPAAARQPGFGELPRSAEQSTGWPAPTDPPGEAVVRVRCGGVPVRLRARREPGIAGIEHAVRLHGSHGIVHLRGRYRQGHAWRFEPPTVTPLDGGRPQALGAPEEGPGDPWYRANERSIQAVVATLRDGPTSPLLFDWERALTLDAAAQASLGTR